MNIFKTILGVLFAFLIFTGLISALAYANPLNDFMAKNIVTDAMYHFLVFFILCFVLIVLTAYFVPRPKKIGVSISTIISYLLVGVAIFYQFAILKNPVNFVLPFSVSGVVLGLSLGLLLSKRLFKKKGWDSTKAIELETYWNSGVNFHYTL